MTEDSNACYFQRTRLCCFTCKELCKSVHCTNTLKNERQLYYFLSCKWTCKIRFEAQQNEEASLIQMRSSDDGNRETSGVMSHNQNEAKWKCIIMFYRTIVAWLFKWKLFEKWPCSVYVVTNDNSMICRLQICFRFFSPLFPLSFSFHVYFKHLVY